MMSREPLAEFESLLRDFEVGGKLALARLITLVENEAPGYRELLGQLLPLCGGGYRVGVTGPPGAGKSSLLDRLLLEYRRRGSSLGVVAVDPSSVFTGGALLGDRIRMSEAALDPDIFIRSLGSRGSLGGLSRQAEGVADLMDAFGKERIFIETVGVGQSELDIAQNCFTTVVVLVPESGDGIQTMKAGLMEIGDLFVVNKADRSGAELLVDELAATLSGRGKQEGWLPPVLSCSALKGEGIVELAAAIEEHRDFLSREGRLALHRRHKLLGRLKAAVVERVDESIWADGRREAALERGLAKLEKGQLSFDALVRSVLPENLDPLPIAESCDDDPPAS
jgi:LAO/AO transport system kinase